MMFKKSSKERRTKHSPIIVDRNNKAVGSLLLIIADKSEILDAL